ncbi:MAG: T9SS type A sorting domain-containing protein [Flavisolibacter sp.]|jgi:hypothetical protein|nr:T9SS type A sorting domain-containing protein [Flavisolibacter sp.]
MLQYPRAVSKAVLSLLAYFFVSFPSIGQGVHVFQGAEYATFNQFSLNTAPGVVWSSERSQNPGYFSAIADAIYSGSAASSTFLVNGYVKYYRTTTASVQSFLFPVGQGTDYRPVEISGTIPANSVFATAWFNGDPGTVLDPTDGTTHDRNSMGPGVVYVVPTGFWDWQTIAGVANGMVITTRIPNVSAFVHPSDLVLLGWDGTRWINLSGAAGTGPYTNNWANGNTEGSLLSGSWQPGITALAIGSRSFVLPIKLESFTGKINGCTASISWKTSEEVNTSHFIVQSTTNGMQWKSVSTISAQGFGFGKEYYFHIAQNEKSVRYRLLMADNDGQVKFSPVISLTSLCGGSETLTVYPNPITAGTGILQIQMQSQQQQKAIVLLQNSAGQVIEKRNIILEKGINNISLSTASLIQGTYMLTVTGDNGERLYPLQKIIRK